MTKFSFLISIFNELFMLLDEKKNSPVCLNFQRTINICSRKFFII